MWQGGSMLFFLGAKISKDNFTFPSKDSGILTSLHSEYCILFREVNMISDQTRGAKARQPLENS